MESEFKKLEKRISDLEAQLAKPKKERKPREPSEFNIHMKNYLAKNKNPSKTHREVWADGVKAWNDKK